MEIVFMFGGQGSQTYGMAKQLYESNEVFRKWFTVLGNKFYDLSGITIIEELYQERNMGCEFHKLEYTHPTIFSVEYALAQTLLSYEIYPDIVWGMSLGEYVAAVMSDIMDIDTACLLINKQVEMVTNKCNQGFMSAILSNVSIYDKLKLSSFCEIAGINFNDNFIVGGDFKYWNMFEAEMLNNKVSYSKLPVDYGFHTSTIQNIKKDYINELLKIELKMPKIKYLSSINDNMYNYHSNIHFWNVIRQPMNFMKAAQVINKKDKVFIDCTPSSTMANLLKYNACQGVLFPILSLFKTDYIDKIDGIKKEIKKISCE